jgi:hypothetical protein
MIQKPCGSTIPCGSGTFCYSYAYVYMSGAPNTNHVGLLGELVYRHVFDTWTMSQQVYITRVDF